MPPNLHPPRADDDILVHGRRWLRLCIVVSGAFLLAVKGSGLALPRWGMVVVPLAVVAIGLPLRYVLARRRDEARRRTQRSALDGPSAASGTPASRESS